MHTHPNQAHFYVFALFMWVLFLTDLRDNPNDVCDNNSDIFHVVQDTRHTAPNLWV